MKTFEIDFSRYIYNFDVVLKQYKDITQLFGGDVKKV